MSESADASTDADLGGHCRRAAECPANAGGECAAGFDEAIDCEDWEPTDFEEVEPAAVEIPRVGLPSGEALGGHELERVLAREPASVVVPLGIVKAGKTSLLCLTYDHVRARRSSNFKFTGSKTILGFARRSFYASLGSGRITPTSARTPREASGLHLHLGMRRRSDESSTPIVFVDVSGEHVGDLVNGKIDPVVARALRRADHVPIVIDGAAIADPDRRSTAVMKGRALIKMVAKQERPQECCVCVVITKGDLLAGEDVDGVFDQLTRGTIAEDGPRFVTADRESLLADDRPTVERGAGVDELLDHLTEERTESPTVCWPTASPSVPSLFLARMWRRAG